MSQAASPLRILMWNMNGWQQYKQQAEPVSSLLQAHDIVILTETHMPSTAAAALLCPAGYCGYHATRNPEVGKDGGVSVFVRNELKQHVSLAKSFNEEPGSESVWLRIGADALALGGKTLLLGACYWSPQASVMHRRAHADVSLAAAKRHSDHVRQVLDELRLPTDEVLLGGDFNARVGSRPDILPHMTVFNDFADDPELEILFDTAAFAAVPAARQSQDQHGGNTFATALLLSLIHI